MKKPKVGAWVTNGGNLYRLEEAVGDEGGEVLMCYGFWEKYKGDKRKRFYGAGYPLVSCHNWAGIKWRSFKPCRKPKEVKA